jgi:nucleoside-diphosphate-sugar epimerase
MTPLNIEKTPHMAPDTILITGGSGCVGSYVVADLLEPTDHHLILILRDPSRLQLPASFSERVTIVPADLDNFSDYSAYIDRADVAVLIAAAWGGPAAEKINFDCPLAIAQRLSARPGKRVIYFSTASVLNRSGELAQEALTFGTEYISSKYRLVAAIEPLSDGIEIVGLFPTLVAGGGGGAPSSHFTSLLREAAQWIGVARFFRVDGRFHFIHAQDVAAIVRAVIAASSSELRNPARFIMGAPAVTVNGCIEVLRIEKGRRKFWKIPVGNVIAEILIRIFRIGLTPWDRYCMLHRDQSFEKAVGPDAFGLNLKFPDFLSILESAGLAKRG